MMPSTIVIETMIAIRPSTREAVAKALVGSVLGAAEVGFATLEVASSPGSEPHCAQWPDTFASWDPQDVQKLIDRHHRVVGSHEHSEPLPEILSVGIIANAMG